MCKKNFNFEVADDSNYRSFIKVQKTPATKVPIIKPREAEKKTELTVNKIAS